MTIITISAVLLITPQILDYFLNQATATTSQPASVRTTVVGTGNVRCNSQSGEGATISFDAQGRSTDGTIGIINSGTLRVLSSMGDMLYDGRITGGSFALLPGLASPVVLFALVFTLNCGISGPRDDRFTTQCGTGVNINLGDLPDRLGRFSGATVECTIGQASPDPDGQAPPDPDGQAPLDPDTEQELSQNNE